MVKQMEPCFSEMMCIGMNRIKSLKWIDGWMDKGYTKKQKINTG
jgi:hypothetical protein